MKREHCAGLAIVAIVFTYTSGCFNPPAQQFEKADLAVTVDQLVDAYRANEVAADSQYKERVLDVTGRIDSVKPDGSGARVLLDTNRTALLSSVECEFRTQSGLSGLSTGQTVTIRGQCKGKSGWINLVNCSLQPSK